jgi:transcriptional regulator with XRE-family HTH domain
MKYYENRFSLSRKKMIDLENNFATLVKIEVVFMNFGEKLKILRKEKRWSQEELSKKIETDTRQVSLYENNKVAPSAETIVRISKVFNVSIDYLLIDEIPRRPLKVNDESIFENIKKLEFFTEEEKKSIYTIIESIAAKNKLKDAVDKII